MSTPSYFNHRALIVNQYRINSFSPDTVDEKPAMKYNGSIEVSFDEITAMAKTFMFFNGTLQYIEEDELDAFMSASTHESMDDFSKAELALITLLLESFAANPQNSMVLIDIDYLGYVDENPIPERE